MTAQDAIVSAQRAGVRIYVVDHELRVKGSKARVAQWGTVIECLRTEITAELDVTVSGKLEPTGRRCTDCGAGNLIGIVETICGDTLCRRCWGETTQVPQVRQPATPRLDRWIVAACAQ